MTSIPPLPVFEFHSGFWLNLHHTLYRIAGRSALEAHSESAGSNTGSQTFARRTACVVRRNFLLLENLRDNDITVSLEMMLIKNQLEDFETCADLAGNKKNPVIRLPGNSPRRSTARLRSIARVFGGARRANRRWISAVAPLVRPKRTRSRPPLAENLSDHWPKDRIRVDVMLRGSTGAYTTLDPLRVTVSSADRAIKTGTLKFSSTRLAWHRDSVQDAIFRECASAKNDPARSLACIAFYTTGELIRPLALDSSGSPSASSLPIPLRIRSLRGSRRPLQTRLGKLSAPPDRSGSHTWTVASPLTTPSPHGLCSLARSISLSPTSQLTPYDFVSLSVRKSTIRPFVRVIVTI